MAWDRGGAGAFVPEPSWAEHSRGRPADLPGSSPAPGDAVRRLPSSPSRSSCRLRLEGARAACNSSSQTMAPVFPRLGRRPTPLRAWERWPGAPRCAKWDSVLSDLADQVFDAPEEPAAPGDVEENTGTGATHHWGEPHHPPRRSSPACPPIAAAAGDRHAARARTSASMPASASCQRESRTRPPQCKAPRSPVGRRRCGR